MSNKPVKGIRIGNYRITPLGIAVLAVLALILIAAIVLAVFHPFGGAPDVTASNVIPDAPVENVGVEEVEATPEPVVTPEPTPTPEPEPRSATIRSLGEIAMQQNLLRAAVSENTFDFSGMFSSAR